MRRYTDWKAWGLSATSVPETRGELADGTVLRADCALVQEAKAAAMGPRRNRAAAREVLAEPLLSVILDQAAQAQDAGWFWTYDLKHAKVGRQMTVMAPPLLFCLVLSPARGLRL